MSAKDTSGVSPSPPSPSTSDTVIKMIQNHKMKVIIGNCRSETRTRVSQCDERNGFAKNLPSLNTGRAFLGCAQFTDNGVKVYIEQFSCISYQHFQVLLVTGNDFSGDLMTGITEILRMDGSSSDWSWTKVGDLPMYMNLPGLRGATLGNVVYMTGLSISNITRFIYLIINNVFQEDLTRTTMFRASS